MNHLIVLFKNNNMNAKEKAEELVLKFLRVENNTPEWFNTHIAKQCALIVVEEIINSRPAITDSQFEYNKYWNDVKSELQFL